MKTAFCQTTQSYSAAPEKNTRGRISPSGVTRILHLVTIAGIRYLSKLSRAPYLLWRWNHFSLSSVCRSEFTQSRAYLQTNNGSFSRTLKCTKVSVADTIDPDVLIPVDRILAQYGIRAVIISVPSTLSEAIIDLCRTRQFTWYSA